MIHRIYSENTERARKSEEGRQFDETGSAEGEEAVYFPHAPNDYPVVKKAVADFVEFQPKLVALMRCWHKQDADHCQRLTKDYRNKHKRWVDRLKRRKRDPKVIAAEKRRLEFFAEHGFPAETMAGTQQRSLYRGDAALQEALRRSLQQPVASVSCLLGLLESVET